MGFGIGVSVGWGVRSNTSGGIGYFNIVSVCGGRPFPPDQFFSQKLKKTDFSEGDYVTDPIRGTRLLLGAFVNELPPKKSTIIQIEGPVYKDCKK